MTTHTHQKAILAAMMDPGFYPHRVDAIVRLETHISSVVLTGVHVYKMKKPVDLGFLDFTTLDKREHFCRREVSLNRRLSSGIYLDCLPITRQGDHYVLNGTGRTVEFLVRMRQLDEHDAMLSRLQRGALSDAEIVALVDHLIDFYAASPSPSPPEGIERLAWEENLQRVESFSGTAIDRRQFTFIRSAAMAFFRRHRDLFLGRLREGRIRDGHGDLRADHIYFTPDGIQIIDCIEFDDRLRILDVISDLAFLAMDLDYHRFAIQARLVIRRYVERSGDFKALPLLDFYRCYRAMVRCKVNCFLLQEIGLAGSQRARRQKAADGYLALAHRYATAFSTPRLWIVCGLPATGKSTIAGALAEAYDIQVLRSDAVRKALFAERLGTSGESAFEAGLYSAYATEVTYRELYARAEEELKRGRSVVLDATFSRDVQRREILRVADRRQAVPVFVECRAAESLLVQRLLQRETEPSLSDARLVHLEAFKRRFVPLNGLERAIHLHVDTAHPPETCLRAILLDEALWQGRPPTDHVPEKPVLETLGGNTDV